MRTWHVGRSRDGFSVIVEEAPAWTYAVEWVYTQLDELTGCRLCGSRLRWAWKVPVGRPRHDEDGWLENSLGSALWRVMNAVCNLPLRHASTNTCVAVADEVGAALWQGDESLWEED